eukprot:897-Eustigmatos_ZCMA.PRE.1
MGCTGAMLLVRLPTPPVSPKSRSTMMQSFKPESFPHGPHRSRRQAGRPIEKKSVVYATRFIA